MAEVADTPTWLTVAEVAGKLKLSKMTVYRMIQNKEIPAYQFGRAYRIDQNDFDNYVANSHLS